MYLLIDELRRTQQQRFTERFVLILTFFIDERIKNKYHARFEYRQF